MSEQRAWNGVGPELINPEGRNKGTPGCPSCGYGCGCCCACPCQTPCPAPAGDGDCDCAGRCHGGHPPWECMNWSTRSEWARKKLTST